MSHTPELSRGGGEKADGGNEAGDGRRRIFSQSSNSQENESSSLPAPPLFSLRVVNMDYYMMEIDPDPRHQGHSSCHRDRYQTQFEQVRSDRNLRLKVPVVRVFGATPMGQKACLHLHGAAPYFLIRPLDEDAAKEWNDESFVASLLPALEADIEKGMDTLRRGGGPQGEGVPETGNTSGAGAQQNGTNTHTTTHTTNNPPPVSGRGGRSRKRIKVVAGMEVVSGKPLYGFHAEDALFIRITIWDPGQLSKVVAMLESGVILGTAFQPYEAHIAFLLQLFVDYNIVGMGYLHLGDHGSVLFRPPLPEHPPQLECEFHDDDTHLSPTDVDVRYRLWLRSNTEPRHVRDDGGERISVGYGDLLDGLSAEDLIWSQDPRRLPVSARHRAHAASGAAGPSKPSVGGGRSSGGGTAGREESTEEEEKLPPLPAGRMAVSELELDADIDDVLNVAVLAKERRAPGKKLAHVTNLAEIWEEEAARRQREVSAVGPNGQPEQPLAMSQLSLSADSDVAQAGASFLDGARNALRDILRRAGAPMTPITPSQPSSQRGSQSQGSLSQGKRRLSSAASPPRIMTQLTPRSEQQQDSQEEGGSQASTGTEFTQAQEEKLREVVVQDMVEEEKQRERDRLRDGDVEELGEDEGALDGEGPIMDGDAPSTPQKLPAFRSRRTPSARGSTGGSGGSAGKRKRPEDWKDDLALRRRKNEQRRSPGASSSGSSSQASTPSRPPLSQIPPTETLQLYNRAAVLQYHRASPTAAELTATMWPTYGLLPSPGQLLHFSNRGDLRTHPGHHHHPDELPEFDTQPSIDMALRRRQGLPHRAVIPALGPSDTSLRMAQGQAGRLLRGDCPRCEAVKAQQAKSASHERLNPYQMLRPTSLPPTRLEVCRWLGMGVKGVVAGEEGSDDEAEESSKAPLKFGKSSMGVLGAEGILEDEDDDRAATEAATPALAMDPNTGQLVPQGGGGGGGNRSRSNTKPSSMAPPPARPTTTTTAYHPKLTSQISPPTPTQPARAPTSAERGFQHRPPRPPPTGRLVRNAEGNRLTVLSIEVHVQTRLNLLPDPALDAVAAVAYVSRDYRNLSSEHEHIRETRGIIISRASLKRPCAKPDIQKGDRSTATTGTTNATSMKPPVSRPPSTAPSAAMNGNVSATGSGPTAPQPVGWCPVCKTKDRTRFCVCGRQPSKADHPPHSSSSRPQSSESVTRDTGGGDGGEEGRALPNPGTYGEQAGPATANESAGVRLPGVDVLEVEDEKALLWATMGMLRRIDPDFLVGWEVQMSSLGYLIDRGKRQKPRTMNIIKMFSRVRVSADSGISNVIEGRDDQWGVETQSGIWVAGRHVLNLWRIMRSELKLTTYTQSNVVAHVLGRRFPAYAHSELTRWFYDGPSTRTRTLEHVLRRARLNVDILDKLDMVGRTAEMARIFGIDFFSVLNRGSQYRVEAVLMRVLKPLNYVAITASRKQVAQQMGLESRPLVFEPRSGVYTDPVAVVDFQSLYPSMIIAYNLCFSTCVGRINPGLAKEGTAQTRGRLGVIEYPQSETEHALAYIQQRFGREEALSSFAAPSGGIFCTRRVREGVLPRMLHEILETRFMIKKAMKRPEYKANPVLLRVLNARQFGLKMIANVTYGYTSASFSGRMPMAELADAIVSSAGRTLVNAVDTVERGLAWAPAAVMYGDTDSMFIQLQGRTREAAIDAGQQIVKAVTALNPPGVVLKFEKVYDTCVLVSKKRYVGRAFEDKSDAVGHFDAKGIESVRRDQCAIVAKIQEKALRILFNTRDLSQVKAYLLRQLGKILSGRVRLQDFVFAREVRLGTYAGADSLPFGAVVATRAMANDKRAEPRFGERVPYVVVCGAPGIRLTDRVVDPRLLVGPKAVPGLRVDYEYYIEKHVLPSLHRVLLCDVNVMRWYKEEVPRPAAPIDRHSRKRVQAAAAAAASGGAIGGGALGGLGLGHMWGPNHHSSAVGGTRPLDHFFQSDMCLLCREAVKRTRPSKSLRGSNPNSIPDGPAACDKCLSDPMAALAIAASRRANAQKDLIRLYSICRACCHEPGEVAVGDACVSLECPVYYERGRVQDKLVGDIEDLYQSVVKAVGAAEEQDDFEDTSEPGTAGMRPEGAVVPASFDGNVDGGGHGGGGSVGGRREGGRDAAGNGDSGGGGKRNAMKGNVDHADVVVVDVDDS